MRIIRSLGITAILTVAPLCARTSPLPADPFTRLLFRLDHAPVNLDEFSRSSQRASHLQQAASGFNRATVQIAPTLRALAASRGMTMVSRIPLIGGPARSAQNGLNAIAAVDDGFVNLTDLDRRHVEPLRQATIAIDRLRRSRNRRDLPAAVSSMQSVDLLLGQDQLAWQNQERKIGHVIGLLDRLVSYLPARRADSAPSLKFDLVRIQGSLDRINVASGILRIYVGNCISDGKKALRQ